jgi:hypothetical protein
LHIPRNCGGDVCLHRQDVAQRTIVGPGPQMLVGVRLDQLGGDAQPIALRDRRAFDDHVHIELARDPKRRSRTPICVRSR